MDKAGNKFFSMGGMSRYMAIKGKKERVAALTSRICTIRARITRLEEKESTEEIEFKIKSSQMELARAIMKRRKIHSA